MSSNIIYKRGRAEITVPSGESIAVHTRGDCKIFQQVGYPNVPDELTLLSALSDGLYTSAAFSSGATIIIENSGADKVLYQVGTDPVVAELYAARYQAAPAAVNATATLDPSDILAGIITSTTGAAVTATLPTGTIMDAASEFAIGDSFDWSAINTGANGFTVAAGTGHTIVGDAVVSATVNHGMFRTRKTAANTFITYRIG